MTEHDTIIRELGKRAREAADKGAKMNRGEAHLFINSIKTLDFDICKRIIKSTLQRLTHK